jgi:hypothetical protein
MSIHAEKIEVICPKCGDEFADWYRPSLDPAASATCPTCGYCLSDDSSVRTEGPWLPEDAFGEAAET